MNRIRIKRTGMKDEQDKDKVDWNEGRTGYG